MKILFSILALSLLVACVEEGEDMTDTMTVICIDGVQYWIAGFGQSQMMAPRIDPKTLEFVRCENE